MFNDMPPAIRARMEYLRELDRADRASSTAHKTRLHQVPPETGKLLAILAASAPEGNCIEVGTSGGYSALWLALACRQTGGKLITLEILEEKAHLATETFAAAGVADIVELVAGDARELLGGFRKIGFCFLDAEKEHYSECYEAVVPNMVAGGILVADNILSHSEILAPFAASVMEDNRVDALVVPIGSGLLVGRRN